MKTLNSHLILLLATVGILAAGCSKNSDFQGATVAQPGTTATVPDSPAGNTSTTSTTSTTATNTVTFNPVSFAEFNSYVAMHPLNNPTNFKITVDLQKVGDSRYAGTVKISYVDNGYNYQGTFSAGTGTNQDLYDLKDAGLLEAEFNRWFLINNQYYFSAFFQDAYGAVVLVIDSIAASNQGDAQGGDLQLSGSVYYKNFAQSYAKQSPYRKCWYIYSGPYNCRASAVIDKSSPYPGDGYTKLGTFSGLSKSAVFK
ncbi:MAG: hypothetical protein ACXVCY_11325 [Pseudobdellovibrionaceae bacterium]